ncbi:hypothetical protein SAMN03159443_00701 [Pseudomonas sp. NFACC15-1]|uniref:hypothetical protein n=1 Tax=unclassified Pseudomonas TaxID=196821 RepID=UPI000883925A|nr:MULTISPECIES: hypothetical protein [unclassified Pseudomonas]SDA46440.1 hypothetical protein SAMN03159443_00701 [Pseudomonas sp. NFACC15-1]SDB10446.1 hypothetical protein SAMN03159290_00773 [Pseudomonas sp. NFACC13-1]SDX18822.1 hypothetical protein SAMN03159380_01776 [Pseudomonas sp. NFACC14]
MTETLAFANAAAALVVLPLAPDRFLGPYDAINLRNLCTLTVMLMAVGALGQAIPRPRAASGAKGRAGE